MLHQIGVSFEVIPSRYREKIIPGLSPRKLALAHAMGKAKGAVLAKNPSGCFILAADTLVACRRQILGKPTTKKDAIRMLKLLSGSMNDVYTAVVLRDLKTKKIYRGVSRTKVFVKKLSQKEIREYPQKAHSYDKAGGYAIQDGPRIVEKIEGSYSNVMGLPLELVKKMLQKAKGENG